MFGKQLTPGTTKSRRNAAILDMRYRHVSQAFEAQFATSVDPQTGVETRIFMGFAPMYVNHSGKATGQTYKAGRNRFKRACRGAGLNRVQVERRVRNGETSAAILSSMVQ